VRQGVTCGHNKKVRTGGGEKMQTMRKRILKRGLQHGLNTRNKGYK